MPLEAPIYRSEVGKKVKWWMENKLTAELFTLCDHVIVAQDGKLSLIGLFTQIFVHHLPGQLPQLHNVAIIAGPPETSTVLLLTITSPEGQTVYKQSIEVKLGHHGRANLINRITNLNLPTTGIYSMAIADTHPIATQTFEVIKIIPAKSSGLPN